MRKEIITKLLNAISLSSQEEIESNTSVQEQISFLFNFLGKDLPENLSKNSNQINQHFILQGYEINYYTINNFNSCLLLC